jgi:hypothetical protein
MISNREVLTAAQIEMLKHNWDFFVEDPPAMAQGGKVLWFRVAPSARSD